MPPAPPPHIPPSTASCNTAQGPWMPIPPPTPLVAPLAVPEPVLRPTWAYAAPSFFEASPTPTLSMSPTVTECSSGDNSSARTIQMHSFVDTPSPAPCKMREPPYVARSSVGGFLSEGGIVPPYSGGYEGDLGWVHVGM
ncbi:hypothetical protein OF83DRAFT_385624 [Amylostereum chailletii]|nr:hypothetical protein OF83DRAFT_385624 [Amylostereum chailletii]